MIEKSSQDLDVPNQTLEDVSWPESNQSLDKPIENSFQKHEIHAG
jgi:hypothetical protein